VELGIGYNFTNFVDDLTNLSYTVQGPFIRMTGKLYDQSPEERARSRAKWVEHRVEIYAKRMLQKEVQDPNSKIMMDLNRMYRMAKAAQQHGKYEESREIYKNIITTTQMMYEEAAQFVRQHIAYEENIYNAYQRAQEYYDKGEFWQARKLWEKIVEEASKAVLE
jgi:tetratricopeptide (TPR) repeat protein